MHLVDTTMFFCERGGGVKRYLLAKQTWLAQHAPRVRHTLLVPEGSNPECNVASCSAFALPLTDGYRLPLNVREWRRALQALGPDLIEAADPYIPAWATRALGQRLGIPTVAFYHSDLPRMLSQRVGRWIAPIARSYLRQLYAGFDLVLAPSHVMQEHLLGAGIERVALQPLGVDTRIFSPERRIPDLRSELDLPAHARLLVYAGRFAVEKNIPALLEAIELLVEPYYLLLIGGERRTVLGARSLALPYEPNPNRLAAYLASCDVFIHAGDQETYGLAALEAMACALPVVAVARGGLRELIDEQVGTLAPAPTPRALAEAVDAIFARDLDILRRAARARAVADYSWQSIFLGLMGHYSRLHRRLEAEIGTTVYADP